MIEYVIYKQYFRVRSEWMYFFYALSRDAANGITQHSSEVRIEEVVALDLAAKLGVQIKTYAKGSGFVEE